MAFELRDRDLMGRVGRLKTKSGTVETPVFMPVINPLTQVIPPKRMRKEFHTEIVITNSYLAKKNFSDVPNLDIHRLLDYDGVIMTDSGAYQILVYGGVEVTQAEIIDYQGKISSDVAVILDIPTGWDVPREEVEYTVDETLRRAEAALPLIKGSDALWVGPIQGGRHLDLVAKSAHKIGAMPYQIHALGSPTEVMERYMFPVLIDMIVTAKRNLPPDRPLHLFGAGHPMMFSLAVALGCDLFDSASYALYAKDGRYLTPNGTLRLDDIHYLPCSCPICRKYTVEELRDTTKAERERLLAEHNLHVCMAEIDVVKQAIFEGSLWDLVERRSRGHPALTSSLKRLCEYREDLERGSPAFKGHGVFYYDYHSLARPEVTRYSRLLIENYSRPAAADTLLLITAPNHRPFNACDEYKRLNQHIYNELGEDADKLHTCFYTAPYGPVPADLSETYPLSQFEIATPLDLETKRHTANAVANYTRLSGHKAVYLYRGKGELDDEVESTLMCTCEESKINLTTVWSNDPWSVDAFAALTNILKTRVHSSPA
jgi:7-cyano-7-deazaguanine tRNA-ribosyltransferase